MQITKYDTRNEEHQRIARLLYLDSPVDGPVEDANVHLIKMDNGLDAYTHLQPNGVWLVHAIDLEEDVPNEADTKEEASRLIALLN